MTENPDGDRNPNLSGEDEYLQERRTLYNVYPPQGGALPEQPRAPKKSKWIACLLAVLVPGLGHFYLGLMPRGLFFMLLFFLDISGIVYFALQSGGQNIPLIVLCSLMIPVIYFFNIFAALHATDKVNRTPAGRPGLQREHPTQPNRQPQMKMKEAQPNDTPPETSKWRMTGMALVALGAILLFIVKRPDWLQYWNRETGTYIGAAILIGAGLIMFLRDRRR
jgi:TM2 domain-containing membrane protein YozV